jgi:hypothetical protein
MKPRPMSERSRSIAGPEWEALEPSRSTRSLWISSRESGPARAIDAPLLGAPPFGYPLEPARAWSHHLRRTPDRNSRVR